MSIVIRNHAAGAGKISKIAGTLAFGPGLTKMAR